jgi:hypothetical protein
MKIRGDSCALHAAVTTNIHPMNQNTTTAHIQSKNKVLGYSIIFVDVALTWLIHYCKLILFFYKCVYFVELLNH